MTNRITAVSLLATGIYATGLAAGAEAQQPVPTATPIATAVATSTPEPTPTPAAEPAATPTPTPTQTPAATPAPPATTPTPTPAPPATTPTRTPVATAVAPAPTSDSTPAAAPTPAPRGPREHPARRHRRRRRHAARHEHPHRSARHRRAAPPPLPAPSFAAPPGNWAAGVNVPLSQSFIAGFPVPPFLLPIYQAAAARYGVPWQVLAAINQTETDYGRDARVSSAGAIGWMQFLPSTWGRYGVDANADGVADPRNPVDAIFAAARYLRAAGAAVDLRSALFAYNHAEWYVNAVLARASGLAGLPGPLVDTLTGLADGRFPVTGPTAYTRTPQGSRIYARAGAAVVAVADGRIVHLGRDVRLQDAYGNVYTYRHLTRIGRSPRRKLHLLAHRAGGIRFTHLRPGAQVVAGTVLGRVRRSPDRPNVLFSIRPAGAPSIDPGPTSAIGSCCGQPGRFPTIPPACHRRALTCWPRASSSTRGSRSIRAAARTSGRVRSIAACWRRWSSWRPRVSIPPSQR